MLSGNRLERRKIIRDNDIATEVDYQDVSTNDTLYNVIKLGLAGLAGYGLYRTGILKPLMKPMLEVADRIAAEGGDRASTVMSTVKQWSKLKVLSPEQLARSKTQKYSAVRDSIFRERDRTIFYDLYQDVVHTSPNRLANFQNVRQVMDASKRDLATLIKMIDENLKAMPEKRQNYLNTELYYRINEMNKFQKMVDYYASDQSILFEQKAMQNFVDMMMTNSDEAAKELKESGYRKLTAGDIMKLVEDTDGNHHLEANLESGIDFSNRRNPIYANMVEQFEAFMRDPNHGYFKDGKRQMALANGDWKNIIIDPAMRIDENGHIIDYRMTKDAWLGFQHSLANDFKLPVVQFNPFKSLLGLDKRGRITPMLGLERNLQIDPNITGHSGRFTIGEFLEETFGEEFKDKSVAIIGGEAFTTSQDGRSLVKLGDGFKVHDITFADGPYALKPTANAIRVMAGLDLGSPGKWSIEEYEQMLGRALTTKEKLAYGVAKKLDIGFQEARPKGVENPDGLDTLSSFDEFTDNLIGKFSKKIRVNGFEYDSVDDMLSAGIGVRNFNYKTVYGEGFESITVNGKKFNPQMITTSKEGFKLSKAYGYFKEGNKKAAEDELTGFFGQFLVGGQRRDGSMSSFTTERTGLPWIMMNQLSEGLNSSSYLLGLSTESKRNPWQYAGNLLLKRALPVYALTQLPGVINYLSEPFFGGPVDETGNRDNIGKAVMRSVRTIDIGAHHAMDLVGATKLFKFLGDMVPGTDQVTELLPLGLGQAQTAEERKEWIENGETPMRKGRFWGSGNTPLTGGKIMYFRPNFYRRVEADVDFSDSKWGSRQEYYSHTWYPNPVNPFAPVNHFLLDKHHYDYKHYYDRPYLQTSPTTGNIPLFGPLVNSTIGKIISPPRKMHKEYWQAGQFAVNPADEGLIIDYPDYTGNQNDIAIHAEIAERQSEQRAIYDKALESAGYQAKQITKRTIKDNSGVIFTERTIMPLRDYDRYGVSEEVYTTPSGDMTVVDVPDELNLYDVNKDLRRYSISRVLGTNQRVNVTDIGGPDIPIGNDNPEIDNAFMYGLGEQYNWAGEVLGLKGFALQQFITGHGNEKASIIEDSGYAYSFNNDFWEENLGGLGANLSEITRRFLPKRNRGTEYINPIRNTMPSWMPGSSYFQDYKHGDPYSKIDNGEERLPGEGYERLHGIHGIMEMDIEIDQIGKGRGDIVAHLLQRDATATPSKVDRNLKGDIIESWMQSGMGIQKEGEIADSRNGVYGLFDVLVNDRSSRTGTAMVKVQPMSGTEVQAIRESGAPLEQHQKEINYQMWATNNTKANGYVFYVDRTNPDNYFNVGFEYDKGLLKETLTNLSEARTDIREAIANGTLGRGELYPLMDRYRILADTAPYSQEFKDVAARISSADLRPEEREEASQIRERMQDAKEPLRLYPYRFKTANLKSEHVTVAKVIDNNTIVTKEYGKEHAIKFAGIRVSESNSEMFDDKHTKNDAAAKELKKYIRAGSKITISYDYDERNKFKKDSTSSINAVVLSHGRNVNQVMLNKGHATEKENDNSPAAIHARYTPGEIAFGSAMERVTHTIADIPFIGNKFYQVRSPYEQYRKREVYGKDFQSWNNPISSILIPHIDENIANNSFLGLGGIVTGAFIGSLFGKSPFGKIVGATVGGVVPAVGKLAFIAGTDSERDWRPKRRRDQEELNEYIDTLKYVKYTRLANQYKEKAKSEDHFDVEKFSESKEAMGAWNGLRQKELNDFKRKVKLDFKHRDRYNFKYGDPKYVDMEADKKTIITQINQEISELQSERKVTKVPENALKAIQYQQMADKTMYGYEPGDSLVNIMSALPKKERQYFKHFMNAPEEEKDKILRIAPSYLRRALQSTWGRHVDEKPTLQQYFQNHALPDVNWVGWDENTDMDSVKVKMVHQNNLDPGEFDIWDDGKERADEVNIPIPDIDRRMSPRMTQIRLQQIMNTAGYENTHVSFTNSLTDKTTMVTYTDARDDVANQIQGLEF